MDTTKLFFDFSSDLAKELIAVSTGIIGLSITFLKDVLKTVPTAEAWALKWSWFMYLFSIGCGFWTLMALTGVITRMLARSTDAFPVDWHLRVPASLQIVSFAGATLLMVIYGVTALRQLRKKA